MNVEDKKVMPYYRTAAIIDLDAIRFNMGSIKEKIGDSIIAGVIKADAYGHGAVQIAETIKDYCGYFAVATIEEALELKHNKVEKPIMILGRVDPFFFDVIIEKDIRPVIFSYEDALELSRAAEKLGKMAKYHIAVDTGMNRIGLQANEQGIGECCEIAKLPFIRAEGIFSHYATADEKDLTKALRQKELFESFICELEKRDVVIPFTHMNNSAGVMNFTDNFNIVRTGILMYGLYPSDDVDKTGLKVKPAMQWVARVSCVKTLEKGREISYGGTYVTEKETVIATIPVGYADGYPRSLSNKGYVLINGKKAPITGRVCMDQFMVDVSEIDDVAAGTVVTLIGKNGEEEITMEEISALADSFNYELPCRISRRVPKIYIENSQEVLKQNYLDY